MVKSENWGTIAIVVVFIMVVGGLMAYGFILAVEFTQEKTCRGAGFDYLSYEPVASEGFIACCLNVYEDNLLVEPYCKAVPKAGWN